MEEYNIESDWKIFKTNIGRWQENYINSLLFEYKRIIDSPQVPSERYWQLYEKIKNDKRKPGVIIESSKSLLLDNLAMLLHDGVITLDDLSQFSEETQNRVKLYCGIKD